MENSEVYVHLVIIHYALYFELELRHPYRRRASLKFKHFYFSKLNGKMPIFNSKNLFYQRKEGFLHPHERQKIISPTFYWS